MLPLFLACSLTTPPTPPAAVPAPAAPAAAPAEATTGNERMELAGNRRGRRDNRAEEEDEAAARPPRPLPTNCVNNLSYGTDPSQTLLVFPANTQKAPVVIWVHGGAFRTGSKEDLMNVMAPHFNAQGIMFVSVEFRKSPNPPDPSDSRRVRYDTTMSDIASAIGWVHKHAAEYGGDPNRIALMGHSSGAQQVALLGTDERYLQAQGMNLSDLRCVASLDSEGYDLNQALATGNPNTRTTYDNAFGLDPAVLKAASPITYVSGGKKIPAFMLWVPSRPDGAMQVRNFANALNEAGALVTSVDIQMYGHRSALEAIGQPGEEVVTPRLDQFFGECLKK